MGDFLKNLFNKAFPSSSGLVGPENFADPGTSKAILERSESMLMVVGTAYRKRFHKMGPTPQGVYWSNEENIKRRYEILFRIFDANDLSIGEASINDLGCGYGALYTYLSSHPIMRGGHYNGYDICENLVESCMNRIKDPRASFYLSDRATESAHYSIISGTFNLNMNADENQWLAYIFASLQELWDNTEKGMAFNLLHISDKPRTGAGGLYYASPHIFETFCKTHLSDNVEIVENYGLPDFTVLVRR